MRRQLGLSLAVAAAFFLAPAPSAKAEHVFLNLMSGFQEIPPNESPGFGLGLYVLSDDLTSLDFVKAWVDVIGGTCVGAHFHRAPAGVNGPIVRGYDPALFATPAGALVSSWRRGDAQSLTEALVMEMFLNNIYFNIHTQRWPGGEIRGQLLYFFSY